MRGSDEGTEMVIAGTIKGLAEEAGLQLPSVSLTHGGPSRKTLARGDKRLAADRRVSVVEDNKRDNAKWVGLMIDHGKRSGIRPSDVKYIVPQLAAMQTLVARINNS